MTHKIEFERLCLHSVRCLKEQRWSTVAVSVVSTGAIGPSVHPPDEAPAGLSLSSQRVRLMLITSTQRSVLRSCWVVFFFSLSLPDRNLETSMRIHFHHHHHLTSSWRGGREERGASPSPALPSIRSLPPQTQRRSCRGCLFAQCVSMFCAANHFFNIERRVCLGGSKECGWIATKGSGLEMF